MQVTYVAHMGNDITVVNAARVSFNKKSPNTAWVSERDAKLIKTLATRGHWSPFAHPQITLHMKLPMFVQRQIDKHQVGFVTNEVSRRYVDEDPEFYKPYAGDGGWRGRPEDSIKQGSGDPIDDQYWVDDVVAEYYLETERVYKHLLRRNVAPEQARMVLPMSMYTESWKTGSLFAWSNLYKLRASPDAQKETQEVARQVGEIIEPLYPYSWKELTNV